MNRKNINSEDNRGMTPLLCACLSGNKHLVKYLVKYGAVISKEDNNGLYPLFYATIEGYEEIIKCLME